MQGIFFDIIKKKKKNVFVSYANFKSKLIFFKDVEIF